MVTPLYRPRIGVSGQCVGYNTYGFEYFFWFLWAPSLLTAPAEDWSWITGLEKTTHSTPLTARSTTSSPAAPPQTHEPSSALARPLLPSQNTQGRIRFKEKNLFNSWS